jgi:hypothetical protein
MQVAERYRRRLAKKGPPGCLSQHIVSFKRHSDLNLALFAKALRVEQGDKRTAGFHLVIIHRHLPTKASRDPIELSPLGTSHSRVVGRKSRRRTGSVADAG